MSKITVIGMGSVGSTIAYKLASDMTASEIVLIDIRSEKAMGEAMDIRQGLAFTGGVDIYAGSYEDAVGSDIVIITSGVARKEGQSRLDLVKTNFGIIMDIMPKIVSACPDAKYIIVSNPVDILTYAFHKYSGLKENQIIGSGTILDTIRLRERIAECYDINSQSVHAYVMGEHGNSSFIPWSLANVSGIPVDEFEENLIDFKGVTVPLDHADAEEYVRASGAKVIARKGATFYAVSLCACQLCKCILSDTRSVLTVSTLLKGEYGIDDVCLSTCAIVGKDGIEGKIKVTLTDDELAKLKASADTLKSVIAQVMPEENK